MDAASYRLRACDAAGIHAEAHAERERREHRELTGATAARDEHREQQRPQRRAVMQGWHGRAHGIA